MPQRYELSESRASSPSQPVAENVIVARQFGRLPQVGLLITVAGLGLIAWTLSRRGAPNDDSNPFTVGEPVDRQFENVPLRNDSTNMGVLPQERGNRPFALFGPDFDASHKTPDIRLFRRLDEALHFAVDGSTIEITGCGPFIVEPSHLEGRCLRIAAAANSQPVLVSTEIVGDQRRPMFETDASLVLEGLELRAAQFHQPTSTPNPQSLIVARGPELRLTRCRLRGGSGSPQPLIRAEVLDCRLSDCEIYSGRGTALLWVTGPCRQLVCQNNLFSGESAIWVECPIPAPDTSLELTRNTFVNQLPLQIHVSTGQIETDTPATDDLLPVSLEFNLFDARKALLGVSWRDESLPRGTFDALNRAVRWKIDRDNLYSVSGAWISQQQWSHEIIIEAIPSKLSPKVPDWTPLGDSPRTADSWANAWGISANFTSHASTVTFARAGLSQQDFLQATNLTAEDFRPRPATKCGADLDRMLGEVRR